MRELRNIRASAWYLLLAVGLLVAIPFIGQATKLVDPSVSLYIMQPVFAVIVALYARYLGGGTRDRLRHKFEKSLIVGSTMSIWFVCYFASGLALTYVHNVVAMNIKTVLINTLVFGVTVIAVEYTRHVVMLMAGRRNMLWFGVIVSVVFALQQMSITQFANVQTTPDGIKLLVSDTIPALVSSALLTYLALTAGFSSQLTYRLGMLAIVFLPPIIPKYDWYLTGVSWLILAIALYLVIDRTRKDMPITGRRYRHSQRAYDIMFLVVLGALVLFMTGALSYQPRAIVSNSMNPVFSRGAIVVVQKAHAIDVRVGDIIQYEGHGHTITHRLIKADLSDDGTGDKLFITKGDNSPSADEPVRSDQITGIVRAQIPYIGYPSVWLSELGKK